MTTNQMNDKAELDVVKTINFIINHTLVETNATLDWRKRDKLVEQAKSIIQAEITKAEQRAELENKRLLYALTLMYSQYCGSKPYGHNFMGAGETAITILEEYDIADELTGVNDKKLDQLESELNQLKEKGE